MLTYQIRNRGYQCDDPAGLLFPNEAEINFELSPLQPFGMEAGNGRTAVQSVEGTVSFNANTGLHAIESKRPLNPLDVIIDEIGVRRIELSGNILKVTFYALSLKDLAEFVQSIFFAYPLLLSIEFVDPVVITRVHGKVGDSTFQWILAYWEMEFDVTTQERQEQRAANSWFRLEVLSEPTRRRLIAALHYFHVGARLTRVGATPWEFLSEAILNFSKTLEVLFPASGEGKSKEAVRQHLGKLGYTREEIERDFVPIIELRNNLDVGHVLLSIFTRSQLTTIHAYAEKTEHVLRELLQRVLNRVQDGGYTIVPYSDLKADKDLTKLIDRLDKHLKDLDKSSKL